MNQFVVTRFNVRIGAVSKNNNLKNVDVVKNEDYLERRFELFEKYTIPSVKNQTVKDFKWIVMFDINTPERFKKTAEALRDDFPQYIPLFVDGNIQSWIEHLHKALYDLSNDDDIVVSRLDNDDAYHERYLETIRDFYKDHGEEEKPYCINYESGIRYIERERIILRQNVKCGHYFAIVCNRDRIITPLEYNHNKISELFPIFEHGKNSVPLWLEVAHESNVVQFRRAIPVLVWQIILNPRILNGFHVDINWSDKESFRILFRGIVLFVPSVVLYGVDRVRGFINRILR